MPEEEQRKLRNILFIQDKFCIGEAAYHELTMVSPDNDLPRLYLINQCKEDLKSICHITRTPGSAQGAPIDFMKDWSYSLLFKRRYAHKCNSRFNIYK